MREYNLKFNFLARYGPNVVANMEDRFLIYADRLDSRLVRYYTIVSLNKDIVIESLHASEQKFEDQRKRRMT